MLIFLPPIDRPTFILHKYSDGPAVDATWVGEERERAGKANEREREGKPAGRGLFQIALMCVICSDVLLMPLSKRTCALSFQKREYGTLFVPSVGPPANVGVPSQALHVPSDRPGLK